MRSIISLDVIKAYGPHAASIEEQGQLKLISKQCSEFPYGFIDPSVGEEYLFIIKDYIGSTDMVARWNGIDKYADYMIVSPYYMVIENTPKGYDANVFMQLTKYGTVKETHSSKLYSIDEVEHFISENTDELRGYDITDILKIINEN